MTFTLRGIGRIVELRRYVGVFFVSFCVSCNFTSMETVGNRSDAPDAPECSYPAVRSRKSVASTTEELPDAAGNRHVVRKTQFGSINEIVYEPAGDSDNAPKKFLGMTEYVIGDRLIGFDVEAVEFESRDAKKVPQPDYFLSCTDPDGNGKFNVLPTNAVRQIPAWALPAN